MSNISTCCCISGGGPAGMMLGFLLARAGIQVTVLEKHTDFLRDFRGDTIHPSTLAMLDGIGLLDKFLALPHQKAYQMTGVMGGQEITMADFTHLNPRHNFIAFMPQWDFLNFLASEAKRYPAFDLRMQTQATDLIVENEKIIGLRATSPGGIFDIRADLVIAADGRHSILRDKAGLEKINLGAPIDALWMRLPRLPTDPEGPQANFQRGHIFVMLERGDYWQCAYVIPKDSYALLQQNGIEAFRARLSEIVPFLRGRTSALTSWDDISLLSVTVDHLQRWYKPGFLCIGDAAHAMSPVGGVGINLAVQDAVAAANILTRKLSAHSVTTDDLARVQKRREFPAKVIQRMQVLVQNRIFVSILGSGTGLSVPWPVKLLQRFPVLQRIPAYIIGIGVRPERIEQ